jgi:hypothetical protein
MSNTTTIDGLRYKIGLHGKVFRWSESRGEWVASTRPKHEVLAALKKGGLND